MSTVDTLREEHEQMQRAVLSSRRAFEQSPLSAFVREMHGAMEDFRTTRAEGVTVEDACRGIEAVLRSVWEKPTSKFAPACDLCDDLGRRERRCTDQMRCGRKRCALHPSLEHVYLEPCGCEKGDRFQPRTSVPVESDIAAAGKVKRKPKGWSRF
jgi:hypothetical protein